MILRFSRVVSVRAPRRLPRMPQSVVIAMPGETLTLRNRTTKMISIQPCETKLFGRTQIDVKPGKATTLTIGRVPRGIYPYAVYSEQYHKFACGSSMPIIIIPR